MLENFRLIEKTVMRPASLNCGTWYYLFMDNIGDIDRVSVYIDFKSLHFLMDTKNDGLLSKLYFLEQLYHSGILSFSARNEYLDTAITPTLKANNLMGKLHLGNAHQIAPFFKNNELEELKKITNNSVGIVLRAIKELDAFKDDLFTALNKKFQNESFSTYEEFKRYVPQD